LSGDLPPVHQAEAPWDPGILPVYELIFLYAVFGPFAVHCSLYKKLPGAGIGRIFY
jgi:hypothetical protein